MNSHSTTIFLWFSCGFPMTGASLGLGDQVESPGPGRDGREPRAPTGEGLLRGAGLSAWRFGGGWENHRKTTGKP